jgi:HrpA-like RNA helicase
MPLPKLKQTNSLIPDDNISEEYSARTVAVEHIMKEVSDRLPQSRTQGAKLEAKTIGDRVIVLESKTGSGKSVTIPPELFIRFRERLGRSVISTMPKVISARIQPTDVIKYYPLKIGEDIGYQTGTLAIAPTKKALIYATVGVLLRQLQTLTDEQFSNKWGAILIDEAHERSAETDIVISLLRAFLLRRFKEVDCPLVIFMSATFDYNAFSKFFDNALVIRVTGRAFPIQITHLKQSALSTTDKTVEIIKEIVEKAEPDHDILVFTSGQKQMELIEEALIENKLTEEINNKPPLISIMMLTSDTFRNTDVYSRIKSKRTPKSPKVKVIISTEVAESSVTIPTIKYVVEIGISRRVEYCPIAGLYINIVAPISKASAEQRIGRAGRVSDGFAYTLYTENTFNAMPVQKTPAMIASAISPQILSLIYVSTDKVKPLPTFRDWAKNIIDDFNYIPEQIPVTLPDMLDNPPSEMIADVTNTLTTLGCLSHQGISLTGAIICQFAKLPVEATRILLTAAYLKCDMLVAVSIAATVAADISRFGEIYKKPVTGKGEDTYLNMDKDTYDDIDTYDVIPHPLESSMINEEFLADLSKQEIRTGFLDDIDDFTIIGSAETNTDINAAELDIYRDGLDDLLLNSCDDGEIYDVDNSSNDNVGEIEGGAVKKDYVEDFTQLRLLLQCDFLTIAAIINTVGSMLANGEDVEARCQELGINLSKVILINQFRDEILLSMSMVGLHIGDERLSFKSLLDNSSLMTSVINQYKYAIYSGLRCTTAILNDRKLEKNISVKSYRYITVRGLPFYGEIKFGSTIPRIVATNKITLSKSFTTQEQRANIKPALITSLDGLSIDFNFIHS